MQPDPTTEPATAPRTGDFRRFLVLRDCGLYIQREIISFPRYSCYSRDRPWAPASAPQVRVCTPDTQRQVYKHRQARPRRTKARRKNERDRTDPRHALHEDCQNCCRQHETCANTPSDGRGGARGGHAQRPPKEATSGAPLWALFAADIVDGRFARLRLAKSPDLFLIETLAGLLLLVRLLPRLNLLCFKPVRQLLCLCR